MSRAKQVAAARRKYLRLTLAASAPPRSKPPQPAQPAAEVLRPFRSFALAMTGLAQVQRDPRLGAE